MDMFQSVFGWVRLRYTSADLTSLLAELEKRRISVYDVVSVDPLTLEYTISVKHLKFLGELAEKRGERWSVFDRGGLVWSVKSVLKRPFLLVGLLMILGIGIYLPGRILFIEVEGNNLVPQRQILDAAEEAGLRFGCIRRNIRSEQIKNQLLDAVPELKWAGVNTYGSRAVITIRERDDTTEEDLPVGVRHIVARRDGVVSSLTVTQGCGNCAVGQAVKKGDVLISGYTDCGRVIRAEAAKGTVAAETRRNLTVLIPDFRYQRAAEGQKWDRFSLVIGKKRINFYKGSGISGGSCVKMSTEYVLTLPGGFELPVSLVKERIADCDLAITELAKPQRDLEEFASCYLEEQMVTGSVIKKEEAITHADSVWILKGQYACIEDIGIEQDEKIGDFHGKTDGADRERGSGG